MQLNPNVDAYLSNLKKWQPELTKLRNILLETGLNEEFKWKQPCYTFQNNNVIILGEFKDYFVLSFLKGVLLKDVEGILIFPGKNSQSAKILKLTNLTSIIELENIIKNYIQEAIEVEKAGLKVNLKRNTELVFCEELQIKLDENNNFKAAFLGLTPGRQRAYNMFFSEPKQSKTRETRIEKYMQRILSGKGLNDCTCGLSKKMPNCDGSHKALIK
jgi:uncharacterized protein YdeI (YjbR/CyaY-like superfamily)